VRESEQRLQRAIAIETVGVLFFNLDGQVKALAESAPERAREKLAVAEETENGIATALRFLLETSVPDGVEAGFSFSGDESLVPQDVGTQVYLVMREAIRNALKHSGCEGVTVGLEVHPGEVVGTVTDDGDGFDPEAASDDGRGIGLRSMRERAEMVGGELHLTSHPGDGTRIEIRVPLEG